MYLQGKENKQNRKQEVKVMITTVAEIKEMVKNMKDTDKVIFVKETMDRDSYPYEVQTNIIAIIKEGAEKVNVGCGIMRYKR